MKKIILMMTIIITGIANISKAQVIGTISNNTPTITCNANNMLTIWNNFLLDYSQIDARLTTLEILKKNYEGEVYYIVLARGSNYKSSMLITYNPNDNNFYLSLGGTISCSTTGCSQTDGCIAVSILNKCTECSSDCTKTTTENRIFQNM